MGEPIVASDTASKSLATRYAEVSSIFSDDLDVPKVLQNIRTRVSCSLISIASPPLPIVPIKLFPEVEAAATHNVFIIFNVYYYFI
jgi:hypothetical protein